MKNTNLEWRSHRRLPRRDRRALPPRTELPALPALNAPVLTFILFLPRIDPILESYFPKLKSKIVKSSESLCLSNIYLLKNKLCEENMFCCCLIFI